MTDTNRKSVRTSMLAKQNNHGDVFIERDRRGCERSADRLQFSLIGLFVGTTFIAIVVAIAVNYPPVAIFALLATSPFLFAAGLALISNRVPALAHAFLVVIVGVTFLVFAFLVQNGLVRLTLDCWQ